ncbi:MAG: hypothetical protein CMA57_00220 [Euryarchaeota archaeon]|nr:hypothetical protein [Euryarchaeota archaeon]
MDNFYEEVYQYLINEGIEEEEATVVVNHLYEANVHEYGLITENRGKAVLNLLRTVGMMSGILKNPAAKKAVKATTQKITGTPLQGNLLTKTGKAQNFTGGRTPFTGTSPVPAASSALPKPKVPAAQSPGQMQIPGTSARAQELRNVTRNPNTGLSGGGNTGLTMSGGKASQRSMPTLKAQPRRVAPKVDGPSALTITKGDKTVYSIPKKDVLSPSQMKAQRVVDKMKALKIAGGVGVVGGTAALVDKANTDSAARRAERELQKDNKLAQQKAETKAASKSKPEPTGERSAKANVEKQEIAKKEAQVNRSSSQLKSAAKNFDAAFADARKKGKAEFSWRGKQYNTKYKGE